MIEYQRIILADRVRNGAFENALRKVIRKGETTVADIGSGTGFLSFLASRLGAKECRGYEVSDLCDLSKAIAKKNGITNCTFTKKHSAEVKNPSKADVVLSETLGNLVLEENILETLQDARRFLKPGGIIIPGKLRQYACPVITDHLHKEVTSWDRVDGGFDFAAAKEYSINNVYVRSIKPADLYDGPDAEQKYDVIDFAKDQKSIRAANLAWKLRSPTTVYGFALWWVAELVPGVELSTDPNATPTHWQQIYLPVPEPIALGKGETMELMLKSDSRYEVKINVAWEVAHRDAKGKEKARAKMDMRKGMIG